MKTKIKLFVLLVSMLMIYSCINDDYQDSISDYNKESFSLKIDSSKEITDSLILFSSDYDVKTKEYFGVIKINSNKQIDLDKSYVKLEYLETKNIKTIIPYKDLLKLNNSNSIELKFKNITHIENTTPFDAIVLRLNIFYSDGSFNLNNGLKTIKTNA